MLTFSYNFGLFRRIYSTFGIRAYTSPDAITPILSWQNDRLVTSYENSRGLSNLSFYLAPQVNVIPGWLVASAYLQYRMERMRGSGYSLTSNAWSGNVTFQLTHWGFALTGQYQRAQRDLWGRKSPGGKTYQSSTCHTTTKTGNSEPGSSCPSANMTKDPDC